MQCKGYGFLSAARANAHQSAQAPSISALVHPAPGRPPPPKLLWLNRDQTSRQRLSWLAGRGSGLQLQACEHMHQEAPCPTHCRAGCHEAAILRVCAWNHASYVPVTAIVPGKKPRLIEVGDPRGLRTARRINATQATESGGL
eukprot:1157959-Pelagomonas_calceolata.AAC.1